jgi:serine protease Do
LTLLIAGTASAQEAKGWLGADVHDVTRAEADKLKWDSPHEAKLGVVASGSPAEKAGLKSGDIILSIDSHRNRHQLRGGCGDCREAPWRRA